MTLKDSSYLKANNPTLNGEKFTKFDNGDFEIKYNFNTTDVGSISIEIKGLDDVFGNEIVKSIPIILSDRRDVNSDDSIDILDLATLATEYNTILEDNNIEKTWDINNDGIIDLYNLVYIARNIN